MRYLIAVLLILMPASVDSGSAPNDADPEHGNGLLEACTAQDGPYFTLCLGYIEGFTDGANLSPNSSCPAARGTQWCPPEKATLRQTVNIIVKYLRDHPETRQERSITLMASAMREAWPCPAQK